MEQLRHRAHGAVRAHRIAGLLQRRALALLLMGCLVAGASASSCSDMCSLNSTAVDPQCVVDCGVCLNATARSGCYNIFTPMWTTDAMLTGDDIPSDYYTKQYAYPWCLQLCPLPWWAWLLIALASLAVLIGIGACCYQCIQRRKRNREVALIAFQAQQI